MIYRAKGNFVFGEINIADFGGFSVYCNTFDRPKQNITVVSIPGRNGDLIYYNGKYDNVERRYTVVIDGADAYRGLAWSLLNLKGYHRLEDSYDPEHYMMASISDVSVRKLNIDRLLVDVYFNRKPQRWLKIGEETVTYTDAGTYTLSNYTGFVSRPFIAVYKDGTISVNNGGNIVVDLGLGMGTPLYIDSEKMSIYDANWPTPQNHNADVVLPNHKFPEFIPGDNTIAWTPEETGNKIVITPRWWEL